MLCIYLFFFGFSSTFFVKICRFDDFLFGRIFQLCSGSEVKFDHLFAVLEIIYAFQLSVEISLMYQITD